MPLTATSQAERISSQATKAEISTAAVDTSQSVAKPISSGSPISSPDFIAGSPRRRWMKNAAAIAAAAAIRPLNR